MIRLYTFVFFIYRCLLRSAALFVPKAKLLISGQKASEINLNQWLKGLGANRKIVWMHCASLGEFEQGRPVLEAIQRDYPEVKILLSFYSPSGFEVRKDTPLADLVVYLPPDYPAKMRQWVQMVKPALFIVVKYELWPHLFRSLQANQVPVYLLSGIFKSGHRYFGWASVFWKPILKAVTHYFVQNELSKTLLAGLGISSVTVSGDTRYDRVVAIAKAPQVDERYKEWKASMPLIILGSSYPEEESVLASLRSEWKGKYKLVIAPHNIDEDRVDQLLLEWEDEMVLASEIKLGKYADPRKSVLLLNTMGELGGIYSMGDMAVVGGGWGRGIHNTLEPAAHGLAVLWGPADQGFDEAKALVLAQAGCRLETLDALKQELVSLWQDPEGIREMGQRAQQHVFSNTGATAVFMEKMRQVLKRQKNV